MMSRKQREGMVAVACRESETLHQSATTRVVRVADVHGSFTQIFKQALGPAAAARQERERAILEHLNGIEGVLVPVAAGMFNDGATGLVFDDPDCPALSSLLKTRIYSTGETLRLGMALARILGQVHERGVIHKDINPANILMGAGPLEVYLIDFDIASPLDEERPTFVALNEITGTLPYMAPEQTGRNARPLDRRADLYSLGATLYAACVGEPPFGTDDPLRIVHDHLARVPLAPIEVDASIDGNLSRIIMRLLEKEPDHRYQSAEGLLHDLTSAYQAHTDSRNLELQLGTRDFPARLRAPSRLLGRDTELAILRNWFDELTWGSTTTGLLSGARGVGKTMLLEQLRAWVTPAGGLFASASFDAHQGDAENDALRLALRSLLRQLLAEPESILATLREKLQRELGPNVALATLVLPEVALLLHSAVPAEASDLPGAGARLPQIAHQLLRATAIPGKPVVLVIENLQWASGTTLAALDAIHMDTELHGVLVLGSWRDSDVDSTHPLQALFARWCKLGAPPRTLHVESLDESALAALLGEVLRLPAYQARLLANDVRDLTQGDLSDTLELVDALRRDGVLRLGSGGWQWQSARIRSYLDGRHLGALVEQRLDALTPKAFALLDAMSCLGGDVPVERLALAAGQPLADTIGHLAEVTGAGLLVMCAAGEGLRFRNERVRDAVTARQSQQLRSDLLLQVARRLAGDGQQAAFAAEPYLQVAERLADASSSEIASVVSLFRTAASQSRTVAQWPLAERYAVTAETLLREHPDALPEVKEHADMLLRLNTHRHAALYGMGRLEEADAVYAGMLTASPDPVRVGKATWTQISSLTNRDRPRDAVALALELLKSLGHAIPETPEAMAQEIEEGLRDLYQWLRRTTVADDLAHAPCRDARISAIARTINRAIPPAFFSDQQVMAWLIVHAGKLWREHGPSASLIGPLSHAAFVTIPRGDDYRGGHDIVQRVLNVAVARNYELDGAQARFTYALSAAHWMHPVEHGVAEARAALDVLQLGGELYFAAGVYYSLLPNLLACARTLEELEKEGETAVSYCARIGNDQAGAAFVVYRQFARSMRGLTSKLGSFDEAGFNEAAYLTQVQRNPVAAANYHLTRALAALLAADLPAFLSHTDAAVPMLPLVMGTYSMATGYLLHALAMVHRARQAQGEERAALLSDFALQRSWFANRAADSPQNFGYLLQLLDAEYAWARGDFRAAAQHYENAFRTAPELGRHWHRALILEQAARCYVANGIEGVAGLLNQSASAEYRQWGATAKLASMGGAGSGPLSGPVDSGWPGGQTAPLRGGELDLLAILRAAQQLQGETDPDRLVDNVSTVLSALSGATSVRLIWRDEEMRSWYTIDHPAEGGRRELSLEEAVEASLLPASAFRYAQRTRVPLVVEDALTDDRFLRDPYFRGMARCSLLVVPVQSRGQLKAMLVLENRLAQAAFPAQRLDGVLLIAGQLGTALDNALLNVSIERRVAQRVQHLDKDNERLVRLSNTDPLTGLANRRGLDARLQDMLAAASQRREPLAIAMIDIDHFKLYNDRYGHQAGDRCLVTVATALAEAARACDLVARYGGEEFVIVLPGADEETALRIIERVRAHVAALCQPHERSPHGVVTLSAGIASMVPDGAGVASVLLHGADEALYQAKQAGRNRVTVHR